MCNYLLNQKPTFAFNVWDFNSAETVIETAAQMRHNVILQTSQRVFEKLNKRLFRKFVSDCAEEHGITVWIHLDHCRNIDIIKQAVNARWDSVMIDASDKPIEENIAITNEIVLYAHKNGAAVEAEVGQIKGVEDEISCGKQQIASYKDIDNFLNNTEVDMIAAAFGNAHGIYKGDVHLRYEIVEYVTRHTDIPFVVHGGSGMSISAIKRLVSISNVKKINISTEIKHAYYEGILEAYDRGMLEKDGFQAAEVEEIIYGSIARVVQTKFEILDG